MKLIEVKISISIIRIERLQDMKRQQDILKTVIKLTFLRVLELFISQIQIINVFNIVVTRKYSVAFGFFVQRGKFYIFQLKTGTASEFEIAK